jgi:hypothetical protein
MREFDVAIAHQKLAWQAKKHSANRQAAEAFFRAHVKLAVMEEGTQGVANIIAEIQEYEKQLLWKLKLEKSSVVGLPWSCCWAVVARSTIVADTSPHPHCVWRTCQLLA